MPFFVFCRRWRAVSIYNYWLLILLVELFCCVPLHISFVSFNLSRFSFCCDRSFKNLLIYLYLLKAVKVVARGRSLFPFFSCLMDLLEVNGRLKTCFPFFSCHGAAVNLNNVSAEALLNIRRMFCILTNVLVFWYSGFVHSCLPLKRDQYISRSATC